MTAVGITGGKRTGRDKGRKGEKGCLNTQINNY